MVPSTWLSVLAFLVFVAPGLTYDLLAGRRRVVRQESTFREIGRTVLASSLLSAVALVIVAMIRLIRPSWFPDPDRLVRQAGPYAIAHYRAIILALLLQVVISVGLAFAAERLTRGEDAPPYKRHSTWHKVFRRSCPDDLAPWAEVVTKSGTYFGQVNAFTPDLEHVDRDLVLGKPLWRCDVETAEMKPLKGDFEWFVVRGDSIDHMLVTYRPPIRPMIVSSGRGALSRLMPWRKPDAAVAAASNDQSKSDARA